MARLRTFLLLGLLVTVVASPALAQPALFFSEYIEGSSFNKCVEIYNNTGETVDLSLVSLQLYSNGNSAPNSTDVLSGTLLAGDVVVICNPNIADPSPADILSGTVNYNGDDAFELLYDGVTVDVIGQIGVDPGSAWGVAPEITQNATLRRNADVCRGDTDGTDTFDPSIEWTGFPVDTFDGLGQHATDCSPISNEAHSWGAVKSLFQ